MTKHCAAHPLIPAPQFLPVYFIYLFIYLFSVGFKEMGNAVEKFFIVTDIVIGDDSGSVGVFNIVP